jgi:AbrB family looped-hinge helix DNA binding protein
MTRFSVISRKGQVTVPQEIRTRLGLKEDDRVEFVAESGRTIIRRAASQENPFEAYAGVLEGRFRGGVPRSIIGWMRCGERSPKTKVARALTAKETAAVRTAIDTNVIAALWSGEPASRGMAALLGRAQNEDSLVISAPVYAELLVYPRAAGSLVREFLERSRVTTDFLLDEAVWQEAGTAYAAYAQRRRRSNADAPKRLLVDFITGVHALLKADRLLTLDEARYKTAFPKLITAP